MKNWTTKEAKLAVEWARTPAEVRRCRRTRQSIRKDSGSGSRIPSQDAPAGSTAMGRKTTLGRGGD